MSPAPVIVATRPAAARVSARSCGPPRQEAIPERREPMTAPSPRYSAIEYFAGIGLARLGMSEAGIDVVWSNDISQRKADIFSALHSESRVPHEYLVRDLRDVEANEIPGPIDLAWASFPCTDLSVAGSRGGIHSGASSAFWAFVRSIAHLGRRRPNLLCIENVSGMKSNRDGKDIATITRALNNLGYSVQIIEVDARHFVPQSRPRVFLIGDRASKVGEEIDLVRVSQLLPLALNDGLEDYLDSADSAEWWSSDRVANMVASFSPLQAARVAELQSTGRTILRTAYRRMRSGTARWELRADGIAGCLRTASGGSSKQAVVEISIAGIRARWMSPMEYARLMGVIDLPSDSFPAGSMYSAFGDAVCVPVVRWIAEQILVPRLRQMQAERSCTPSRKLA
jgi:DNA (cytosine-5)-methyltransferase 1